MRTSSRTRSSTSLTGCLHSEPPAPLSKSAIKKAKALARAEKRQQEKAARAAARKLANGKAAHTTSPPTTQAAPDSPDESLSSPTDSVEWSFVADVQAKGEVKPVSPVKRPATESNGDAHPPPRPTQPDPVSVVASEPAASISTQKAVPDTDKSKTTAAPPQKQPLPAPPEKPAAMANGKAAPTPKLDALDTSAQQAAEKSKKRQSFLTRTLWTFIMIGGFISAFITFHIISSLRMYL